MQLLLHMFAALGTLCAAKGSDVYWWQFPKADCGYDDVAPQPSCSHRGLHDLAALKKCCLATPGCGGFNTNGIIKKTDCLSHKKPQPLCDLYVKESTPQPAPRAPVPIWPAPKQYTRGNTTRTVDSGRFAFASATKDRVLSAAFARYQPGLLFPHTQGPDASKADPLTLQVTVAQAPNASASPQLDTDESYSLTIPAQGGATLHATSVFGVLRGLETFAQLVRFDFSTETYHIAQTPWTITDAPRFPHRGLMLDTARHFETLAAIRRIIESLSYAKLNVFHWHISDDQSFPMQSTTSPKLWEGAFSHQQRYTQADIKAVVEFARLRGVRVMIEFDMPGHASSWCTGYPEICPSPHCHSPLNVANDETFDRINSLLKECTGLFPGGMMHLGGDEVNTGCWTKTPAVAAWLKARNMTGDDGYAYFVKKAADMVIALGKRPVQWVEVFDHFGSKLDKRTVVHVWKAKSTLKAVTAAGYEALINNSPGSNSWYLDHLSIDWGAVYDNEPCDDLTPTECSLVLGGQGEMWGETVDASDVESTVWPKLAAIAERLWSPRAATAARDEATHSRIEHFRCLLNRRGIRAAPVNNRQARSAPPGPGSCLDQRRE